MSYAITVCNAANASSPSSWNFICTITSSFVVLHHRVQLLGVSPRYHYRRHLRLNISTSTSHLVAPPVSSWSPSHYHQHHRPVDKHAVVVVSYVGGIVRAKGENALVAAAGSALVATRNTAGWKIRRHAVFVETRSRNG